MSVNPIPEGFHTVTPYFIVQDAAKLSEFLQQAFEAKELFRMHRPTGGIAHAQMIIGGSMIMLGDAQEGHPPKPLSIYLYVENTDALYDRALKAGATSMMAPMDQFYGDRSGGVVDPFGNQWWIGTHLEDLSMEEIEKRAQDFYKAHPEMAQC